MRACVRDTLALRAEYGALRRGAANVLHEDRANGVVAFERVRWGGSGFVVPLAAFLRRRVFWWGGDLCFVPRCAGPVASRTARVGT